jgi:hypothetical protein
MLVMAAIGEKDSLLWWWTMAANEEDAAGYVCRMKIVVIFNFYF